MKVTSYCGIFLGFGNNVAVIICYMTKTKCMIRCLHAMIDDHEETLQVTDRLLTPSGYMLRYYPTVKSDSAEFCAQLPQLEINLSDFDFIQSLFDASKCISLDIILPPKGMYHGLTFDIYQVSRTPIIIDVHPLSLLRPYIPTKYSQTHYI